MIDTKITAVFPEKLQVHVSKFKRLIMNTRESGRIFLKKVYGFQTFCLKQTDRPDRGKD